MKWILVGFIVIIIIVIGLAYLQQPDTITSTEYLTGDYSDKTVYVRGVVTYIGGFISDEPTGVFQVTLDDQLSLGMGWDAVPDVDVGDTITIKIINGRFGGVV